MNLFFENLKQNYSTLKVPHFVQNQLVSEFEGDSRNAPIMLIIKAIQSSKKNTVQFESVSLDTQIQWFEKIKLLLEQNQKAIIQWEAMLQGNAEEKHAQGTIKPLLDKIREMLNLLQVSNWQEPQAKPTIGCITPATYSFFEIGWRILFSLFHRTPIIIKPAVRTAATSLIWVEILKTIELPESWIQIIQGDGKTVGQFILDHPGISHLSVSASYQTVRTIAKNISFLEKKYQFYTSGKNAIILLSGFPFQEKISEIAKLLVLSTDGSPMSVSKIFITETIEKEFKSLLVKELESLSATNFAKLSAEKAQQLQTVGARLVAEGANKLFQDPSFLLLADLTNCSEWHQEASELPIVNITTVKYQHEIPKWLNNTAFGHSIFVFGESEKVERFSKKVEARNVFINPKEINNGFYFGFKQSSFGEVGFELPNSFFSFSKQIIG